MGLPARRLEIPAGFALSTQEIIALLDHFNARAGRGEVFDVATGPPHAFTIGVGIGAVLTAEEISCALGGLDRAKRHGNADISFTFSDARLVKKGWILLKDSRGDDGDSIVPVLRGVRVREF